MTNSTPIHEYSILPDVFGEMLAAPFPPELRLFNPDDTLAPLPECVHCGYNALLHYYTRYCRLDSAQEFQAA